LLCFFESFETNFEISFFNTVLTTCEDPMIMVFNIDNECQTAHHMTMCESNSIREWSLGILVIAINVSRICQRKNNEITVLYM
jgi:hypothetical protein